MRTFAATLGVCLLACAAEAQTVNFDGAWANNEGSCAKVFVKRGNKVSLAKDSDMHGSGFIVDGNQLRGKVAACTIKSRKMDGAVLLVHAVCSTDVALQNVVFGMKPEGANKIIRVFQGIPELDTPFYRCPM
jgi:hypothetical protein